MNSQRSRRRDNGNGHSHGGPDQSPRQCTRCLLSYPTWLFRVVMCHGRLIRRSWCQGCLRDYYRQLDRKPSDPNATPVFKDGSCQSCGVKLSADEKEVIGDACFHCESPWIESERELAEAMAW